MVEIHIDYQGQLRCQATHTPSGATLHTDAPVDNQGRGEAFSPTDLAATALGTCMATLMGIAAQQRAIDISGVRVVVRKAMSSSAPRRIARLEVDYFIPLPGDHPQRQALEAAAVSCPVRHSLHPDIEQKIAFYWQ